jgi:hypothetical protein
MPAMVAASSYNPEVREAMHRFSASRRSRALEVLERAVARGEVRGDVDLDLVVDTLSGPVFYRHLITGRPVNVKVLGNLVELVLAGIRVHG